MEIVTLVEHRMRGYAYKLANGLVKTIKALGYIPYWDCTRENTGSVSLANKLGLKKRSSYKCYWSEV